MCVQFLAINYVNSLSSYSAILHSPLITSWLTLWLLTYHVSMCTAPYGSNSWITLSNLSTANSLVEKAVAERGFINSRLENTLNYLCTKTVLDLEQCISINYSHKMAAVAKMSNFNSVSCFSVDILLSPNLDSIMDGSTFIFVCSTYCKQHRLSALCCDLTETCLPQRKMADMRVC